MEERIGIHLAAIVPKSAGVKKGLVYAPKNARRVQIPHCRPTTRISDRADNPNREYGNQL